MEKMKRKVGYGQEAEYAGLEAEHAMKKLCLIEQRDASKDINMLS